jgi:arabinogalactan oligomer/maltooligosaccharide transport system permease protein
MLTALLLLSTAQPAGELTLWHAWRGAEQTALEAAIAAHAPNVKAIAMPFDGFSEKISAALSHKEGPDLFIYPHDRLGQWRKEGALLSLKNPEAKLSDHALDALRDQGALYGLPLATKALVLYGRESGPPLPGDLAKAPSGRVWIATSLNSYYEAFPWLAAAGARPFDAKGRPTLNSIEHQRGLEQLSALIDASTVSRGLDAASARAAFIRQEVPFLLDGPWALSELTQHIDDLKVLALPRAYGEQLRAFATVEAVFVSAHSKQPDSARKAAHALAGDGSARLRALQGSQLVPNRALWRELSQEKPLVAALALAQQNSIPLPTTPAMRAFWGPAKDALTGVLRQGRNAEAALAESAGRIAHLLAPLPARVSATPWIAVMALLLFGLAFIIWRRWQNYVAPAGLPGAGTLSIFMGPGLAALLLLVATPILTGVAMSFFAHGDGDWHLVGLANYGAILRADGLGATHPLSFWFTLFVTVAWTVFNVVLHVGIGVGLALILNQPALRLSATFRVLLILPWAIPNYVTALAWRGLFDQQIGAINALITAFGGSGVAWWDQSLTAFSANLTTNVWLGFPFMMVTALGALASLPSDQIEAARMDGASAWMRLRHIILPQLLPAMIPAMLLGTIWTFNAFNVIYLVSGGDPAHSTDILVSEAYRWAFEGQGRYGYAAAYSVLIFGLLLLFGLATNPRKARA